MLLALVDIADLLLSIVTWVIIIQVVLSWLFAFNVLNTSQGGVRAFAIAIDRLTAPLYRPIRRILPDFGGIDFSLSRTRTVRVTGKSLNAAGEQKTAHTNERCSKVEGRLDARVAGSANHDATDRVVGPPSDR